MSTRIFIREVTYRGRDRPVPLHPTAPLGVPDAPEQHPFDLASARLLIVSDGLQQRPAINAGRLPQQAEGFEQRALARGDIRGASSGHHAEFGRNLHPPRHRLAVPDPAVTEGTLETVPDGMTVIQDGAPPDSVGSSETTDALIETARATASPTASTSRRRILPRNRAATGRSRRRRSWPPCRPRPSLTGTPLRGAYPGNPGRRGRQPVGGERPPGSYLRQVDRGLAPDAAVDHRQQRGRNLQVANPAQPGRRGKAGDVPDGSAAERHQGTRPVDAKLTETLEQRLECPDRLCRFPGGQA